MKENLPLRPRVCFVRAQLAQLCILVILGFDGGAEDQTGHAIAKYAYNSLFIFHLSVSELKTSPTGSAVGRISVLFSLFSSNSTAPWTARWDHTLLQWTRSSPLQRLC